MDPDVVARRRKLALLQHERVVEEAEFVAELTRQARNRAAATAVRATPAANAPEVRDRVNWRPGHDLIRTT